MKQRTDAKNEAQKIKSDNSMEAIEKSEILRPQLTITTTKGYSKQHVFRQSMSHLTKMSKAVLINKRNSTLEQE